MAVNIWHISQVYPDIRVKVMVKQRESELFRQFIGDVEPLEGTRRAADMVAAGLVKAGTVKRPADKLTPGLLRRRAAAQEGLLQTGNDLAGVEHVTRVKPWDILSFKRDGVQHGVFRKLKLGKYDIDVSIDLHRLTVDQARVAVREFVTDCVDGDIRCAMITHGKGQNRESPALLKSCVNHWLRQMDEVLALHSACQEHGGSGATYILLRKSLAQKEKNREQFARSSCARGLAPSSCGGNWQ